MQGLSDYFGDWAAVIVSVNGAPINNFGGQASITVSEAWTATQVRDAIKAAFEDYITQTLINPYFTLTAVGADKLNTLHLHNTRGLGLANALAGLEEGITTLDASLGGLGGCPFAPGASGNIVTEDLVFMLQAMGLATGIDLERF